MPERILGLDIGASSLKAVLLSRGFRGGYRVVGARRIELAGPEGLAEALRALFSDPAFQGLTCVTALPAGELSFRSLRLPFRDDRRIGQALAFALEPLIPLSLDEVFIDYRTHAGPESQAGVFAAIAPRDLVVRRMEALAPHCRETAVVDVGAVPLAIQLTRNRSAETALLIDLGARDTTAVFASQGKILQVRHLPLGAGAAEGVPVQRLCQELKNTVTSLRWQGVLNAGPARVLLTGGGSLAAGLAEALGTGLCLPVVATDLARATGIAIDGPLQKTWEPALMDQALALAARPLAKGSGFNFRQRFDAAGAGYGALRTLVRRGAGVAAAVLALVLVEWGTADWADRLRLAALKQDLQAAYQRIDPEAKRIVDPVAQLRGKIAEAKKVTAGLGEAAGAAPALDLLREIAQLAPADLLITSLNLDGAAFSLKGQAASFDSLEALKKTLAQARVIRSVTITSSEQLKPGEGVSFDLKGVLKP